MLSTNLLRMFDVFCVFRGCAIQNQGTEMLHALVHLAPRVVVPAAPTRPYLQTKGQQKEMEIRIQTEIKHLRNNTSSTPSPCVIVPRPAAGQPRSSRPSASGTCRPSAGTQAKCRGQTPQPDKPTRTECRARWPKTNGTRADSTSEGPKGLRRSCSFDLERAPSFGSSRVSVPNVPMVLLSKRWLGERHRA